MSTSCGGCTTHSGRSLCLKALQKDYSLRVCEHYSSHTRNQGTMPKAEPCNEALSIGLAPVARPGVPPSAQPPTCHASAPAPPEALAPRRCYHYWCRDRRRQHRRRRRQRGRCCGTSPSALRPRQPRRPLRRGRWSERRLMPLPGQHRSSGGLPRCWLALMQQEMHLLLKRGGCSRRRCRCHCHCCLHRRCPKIAAGAVAPCPPAATTAPTSSEACIGFRTAQMLSCGVLQGVQTSTTATATPY